MMKTRNFTAAAGITLLAALATQASAQSIDYGSLEQLFGEPVTTSATGSPQRSTEVPVDMTIISAEDIKRSGASDIPTILSRVAGVDILPFSAGASELSVRGYNQARSPRMLVLINGRQVYLDHFGYTDWYTLPVALGEIRQIELVRGPNSALFGFNAVSGVINIITYNPEFDDVDYATAATGSLSYNSANIINTFRLGRLSARMSVAAEGQDEWLNTNGAITAAQLRDPQSVRAGIDAVVDLGDTTNLRVETSYTNSGLTEMLSGYSYVASRVKSKSLKATLNSDTAYGSIQAQGYINKLDSSALPLHYYNTISVASVQDLFKVGANHTVRVALEYRHNKVNTTSTGGGQISYIVYAPSVMWNWQAAGNLSLTAAARYDSLNLHRSGTFPAGVPNANNALWDKTIQDFSFNLGAVYAVTDKDTLRLTAARGLQAPTLVELGSRQVLPTTPAPTGLANLGNPNLKPAIVTNYEATYDRALPRWRARAAVKLFMQHTDDVKSGTSRKQIDIPATSTTWGVFSYVNMGKSDMTGAEISASGRFGQGFRWTADTTHVEVEDKPIPGYNPVIRLVAYSETTPKWRSNLSLGWSDGTWSADGYVHSVSRFNSYISTGLEPVPAYTSLGGRLAWKGESGLEVSLNGQNLLEERQMQAKAASGLQVQRRVVVQVGKSW
jgi:outer membrane receptor for ferrienterochelin and colicins